MSDWKTSKWSNPSIVPSGTWKGIDYSFSKIPLGQKNLYSEGSKITDDTNPVWEVSDGDSAIIPVHEPCGYWYSKEERKPPRTLHYASGTQGVDAFIVEWMPISGLPYGRFVANYYDVLNVSDDGGYTWYALPYVFIGNFGCLQTLYLNDGTVVMMASGSKIYRSFNGVNWEVCGDLPLYNKYGETPSSFSYHPPTDTIVCASNQGGGLSFVNTSIDEGLTWVQGDSVNIYCSYLANVFYKNYTYIMSYNYEVAYRSAYPAIIPSWQVLTGLLSPWDYVLAGIRYEAATNEKIITYNRCYFNGIKWFYHGAPLYRVSYHKQMDLFAATIAASVNCIVVSVDGISWLPISTLHFITDVAVGNDRIVGVGYSYHTTTIITY